MRTTAALAAVLFLLAGCATDGQQGPVLAWAAGQGTGDVRTDGDVVVVVGDLDFSLGLRTATGLPLFIVPPVPMERNQWYVRSVSRGFEKRSALTEPMPAWVRPLFLDDDLRRLAGLGIFLVFEDEAPLAGHPAPAGDLPEP